MTDKTDGGPAYPNPALADEAYVPFDDQTGMTLRQYAAIELRVPDSGTDWLDEMIRQSKRDEIAGLILSGMANGMGANDGAQIWMKNYGAKNIYLIADAMIAAGGGE